MLSSRNLSWERETCLAKGLSHNRAWAAPCFGRLLSDPSPRKHGRPWRASPRGRPAVQAAATPAGPALRTDVTGAQGPGYSEKPRLWVVFTVSC